MLSLIEPRRKFWFILMHFNYLLLLVSNLIFWSFSTPSKYQTIIDVLYSPICLLKFVENQPLNFPSLSQFCWLYSQATLLLKLIILGVNIFYQVNLKSILMQKIMIDTRVRTCLSYHAVRLLDCFSSYYVIFL